jgi:hypothetical protein
MASPAISPPREPPPAVDRPSRASTGQIDPTSATPYLRPCFATIPLTQNQTIGEEPSSGSPATGSPRRGLTALLPPDAVTPPPLSGVWARAHGVRSRRPLDLFVGCLGPFSRGTARPRSAGPKSPSRAQLTENPFPFSFPIFIYICIY